jgi:hypothetical protein
MSQCVFAIHAPMLLPRPYRFLKSAVFACSVGVPG